MSFRSASEVSRDVVGAYWAVLAKVEDNPECTYNMMASISHVLDQIYWLPINECGLVRVASWGVSSRLRRIHRWIVQWPRRLPIDEALACFEQTFWANYRWLRSLQGDEQRRNIVLYVADGEDLYDYNESESESTDTDSTQNNHNHSTDNHR
jgi:hypothetical protein